MTNCTVVPLGVRGMRVFFLAGLIAAAAAQAADGSPGDALGLSATYRCMACHGMVHKQVGPGFAQIAARYQGDAAAPERMAGKIRGGGVGEWGRVIMPRQPKMTVAESETLARWVLAQPPRP